MADLRKDMENGEISFEMVAEAMKSATSEGGLFYQSLEKQSKTMTGMLSTLKDNLAQFGRDAGEKAFEQVKGSLQSLLDMIDKASKDGTLDDIAEDVGNALNNLVVIIIDVSKLLYEYKDAVVAGAAAMIAFKATLDIGRVADSAITTIKSLKTAIAGIGSTASTLGAVGTTAGSAIALVGASLGIVYGATKAWGASVEYLNNKAEASQKQAEQLKSNIDDTKTKLSELNSKIAEIRDKGTITLVDEKQLKALKDQKEVLEATLILNEELLKSQNLVAEQDATKALNKKSTGTNALKIDLQTYKEDLDSAKALNNEYVQAVETGNTELANSLRSYVEGITPTLEADKNMLLSRKEQLTGLMEGISGLTDEGRTAKAELQALIDEINTLLGIEDTGTTRSIVSGTADYYKQQGEEKLLQAQKSAEDNDKIFTDELNQIEKKHTRGLISDGQYYSQKDALLKKYNKDQLAENDSFYGSLKSSQDSANKEYLDNEKKTADETAKAWQDSFEDISKDYESKAKDIENQQNALVEKLSSAELFSRETVGEDDNVVVLTNFQEKFQELEKYQQLLDEIRSKGAGEGFADQIKDMGVTDAVDFMETLLKSDDIDNYLKGIEQYNAKANEIAQNEFADENKAIKDEFANEVVNVLGEIPAQAAEAGTATAEAFAEALIKSDAIKKIQSTLGVQDINSFLSAVSTIKSKAAGEIATGSAVSRQAAASVPIYAETGKSGNAGVIEIHTTVELDRNKLGESVTKWQTERGYQSGKRVN